MAEKKSEGVKVSFAKLKKLGIQSEKRFGLIHCKCVFRGRQHLVELNKDYEGDPIRLINIDLSESFGKGFPEKGFVRQSLCDRHYVTFRLLHEIAQKFLKDHVASGKIEFFPDQGWDGDEVVDYCVQIRSRIDSIEDIEALIQTVKAFDKIVTSPHFKMAVNCLHEAFQQDLETHLFMAMR